mgnify:CR=1 FL=1
MQNLLTFCKKFRKEILNLTLQEMENKTGVPLKTISSFENGNSTNIKHLNLYYKLCDTKQKREQFIQGIDYSMDRDNNNVW